MASFFTHFDISLLVHFQEDPVCRLPRSLEPSDAKNSTQDIQDNNTEMYHHGHDLQTWPHGNLVRMGEKDDVLFHTNVYWISFCLKCLEEQKRF